MTDRPTVRTLGRCTGYAAAGLSVLASVLSAAGCSKKPEQRTVIEIKRDYAERLVAGMKFGEAGRIKASSFDDRTFLLHGVTIDGPTQIVSAGQAEILVDVAGDTMRLRLLDVIGAAAEDPRSDAGDAGGGGIGESAAITTAPIKLNYDAVP